MTGDLVAKPVDETKWYSGISQLEDAKEVKNAVENGDWLEAGLGAVPLGMDLVACATDPTAALGMVIEAAVGWLMEHLEPLKEALDKLAGNPEVVKSFGQTWQNVADRLNAVAEDLQANVTSDLAEWTGSAADSYRAASADRVDALRTTAETCAGVSSAVTMAGEVVAAVRVMVRDLIAALVSGLIEAVLPPGPGTARAAVKLIRNVLQKVVKVIGKLVRSLAKLARKLPELIRMLAKVAKRLKPPRGSKVGPPSTKPRIDPNSPDVHKPDGTTTPSSDSTTTSSAPDTHKPPDTTSPASTTTPSSTTSPDANSPSTTKSDTTSPSSSDSTSPSSTKTDTTPSRPSTKDSNLRDNADNPRDTGRSNDGKCTGADPIDLATGEMLMTQTDLELPGALPLVIRRTHLSSHLTGRSLGRSWASTFDQRLEIDDLGVCFAAADGVLLVYPTPPQDGTAVMPVEGARHALQRVSADEYTLSVPPGLTLRFRARGPVAHLSSIVDRNDNWIEFARTDEGIVTSIAHSGGYRVAVTNDGTRITGFGLESGRECIDLVRYRYDDKGRLTDVVNSSGRTMRFDYDTTGRVVRWQDRNDEWYRYVYDERGRCVRTEGSGDALACSIEYSPGVTTYTNSLGHSTVYHFNEAMQLSGVVDALGNTTSNEWDRYDRPLVSRDALGRETRYEYDEMGNLIVLTRPDGKQTRSTYNEWGQPIAVTGPDGLTRRADYDDRGNIVALVSADGAVTRMERDARGTVSRVIDPAGAVRRVVSNAAGLPLMLIGPDGATTRYVRDDFGRVNQVVDPAGNVRRMTWTVEGQLLSHAMPDGSVERWKYDGEGNAVEHTNAIGGITRIETTHFDLVSAETTPDGSRIAYGYDSELRLVSVTNGKGEKWRYEYDARGALVAETDFNGRTLRYERDAAGQLTARTNALGQTISYRRDPLGDVIERRTGDAMARFEYDAEQRLIRATNDGVLLELERDAAGRVTAETINGRTVRSTYDKFGRRTSRLTPTGALSRWEYRDADQPARLHTAGRIVSFDYDPAGREVERLLDTGVVMTQTWDRNNRLATQVVHTSEEKRVTQQRTFRYRADGYVSAVAGGPAGVRQFDLDSVGRVTAVRGNGWQEAYTYDVTGCITSAVSPSPDSLGSRQYDETLVMVAGDMRFSYDPQGRMVVRQKKRLSRKPETWRYEWNAEDLLVGVTTPDGTRWRYVYDALGRRVAKEKLAADGSMAERTDFAWDGPVLAEQVRSDGRATSWDFAPGRFEPVTQTERRTTPSQEWVDEQFYAIITDIVGTPTELVDPRGQIAWRAESTVWGEQIGRHVGSAQTPLRFAGQYFDEETGLHYNYARYYDPASGRFISTDPLGINGGDDCHAYVVNPRTWIDPYGLGGALPRRWYEHSDGWRLGLDVFPIAGSHDFEFHVYRNGEEIGVWGSEGWFLKHRLSRIPDPGEVPPHIEGRLKNMSIELLRKGNRLPEKGSADITGDKWKRPRLSKKCENK